MLLDCGLFQGLQDLRHRNWGPPGFDPARLAAVVLSHAHIDHSGYLPVLVRKGFRGPVFCTSGTADLLRVLLLDAAKLQEEEAAAANRYGYSRHHPALPLYTTEDAERAIALAMPRRYGEPFQVAHGVETLFRRAGHILGSATVELRLRGTRLVFSGDLGRWDRPILRDPELVPEADVLLIESTYGDRDARGGRRGAAGAHRARGGSRAAARSSSRRSRWGARRSSSGGSGSSRTRGASRRFPCSSTARWRSTCRISTAAIPRTTISRCRSSWTETARPSVADSTTSSAARRSRGR